jgi:Ca-activated chloride channel homolog
MTFQWHEALGLSVILPILVGTYLLLLGRKKKEALRYSHLSLVREGMDSAQRIRLHLPPLLFLVALFALVIAMARPTALVMLPAEQRTIILAMDVSWSMGATDVAPTRLAAAQAAARRFIHELPRDARVGLLAFSGNADLVQPPTTDHAAAISAIDGLTLQSGTAIGGAMIAALLTLFPSADIDRGYDIWGLGRTPDGPALFAINRPPAEKQRFAAVPPGSCTWAAIVLLTDGSRTMGPDPIHAAHTAADLGVRVFTVGFGATGRASGGIENNAEHSGLDEATLKDIAAITHAQYFRAGGAEQLRRIYETLSGHITLEKTRTEITALFTAVAAVFTLASVGLSLLWCNRLA